MSNTCTRMCCPACHLMRAYLVDPKQGLRSYSDTEIGNLVAIDFST